MSTNYITTVPNPPQAPKSNVQDMQNNALSIYNIWLKDHYTFNDATPGLHAQVTFPNTNVPSVPTTPPVLFTNTQDGNGNNLPNLSPQLFFYSDTAVRGKNNYVSASSGSTFLFGGIILKWGLTGSVASGTSIGFASPFPNACFSVTCAPKGTFPTWNVDNLTPSKFDIFTNPAGNINAYYIAIGN